MITIQRNKESGREPGTLSRACKAEKFQVFFCPCHRHIEDPSFLFTMLRLPGASVGKVLLITVRDPHMVEFQSLCRMYRQQSDPAVFLFFPLLLHATPYSFPALQLFPVKLLCFLPFFKASVSSRILRDKIQHFLPFRQICFSLLCSSILRPLSAPFAAPRPDFPQSDLHNISSKPVKMLRHQKPLWKYSDMVCCSPSGNPLL